MPWKHLWKAQVPFKFTWHDWIQFNFKISDTWTCLFLGALWQLWLYRNTAVFEINSLDQKSLFNHLIMDLCHTNHVLQVEKERNLPCLGGGGVIRRHSGGSWFLGYSINFTSTTAKADELHSLREGIALAKSHNNITHIEIETDVEELLTTLTHIEKHHHSELAAVLLGIHNHLAHKIANLGANMAEQRMIHIIPPSCAMDVYQAKLVLDHLRT